MKRELVNHEQKQLLMAMLASLLIHFFFINNFKYSVSPKIIRKILEIELVHKNPEKKQIVAPSQAKEEEPKSPTNLLSEKNSSTRVEQIKRGEIETPVAMPAPKSIVKKQEENNKSSQDSAKASSTPVKTIKPAPALTLKKEDFLLKKDLEIEEVKKKEKSSEEQEREIQKKLSDYQPFSRNFRNFSPTMRLGTPDFLPNIQDGEVTLLNAKAERYSIFVRRVAYQVFGSLRRFSWQELAAREIGSITNLNTIHATLSKTGELLSVEISSSSGSTRFDEMVLKAAKNGAWDQNPPAGVEAEDGKIHFIFKSRSWARFSAEGFGEQRWLLLSTGLL